MKAPAQLCSALPAPRAMMMTACDLSAITKPWEVQSKVRAPGWGLLWA